jgi:anti-sigma B factor antagonist
MKIEQTSDTLTVQELPQLNAVNSSAFRDEARAALTTQKVLDVDLSQTRLVDSSGLAALISLHKTMLERKGQVRVLNPSLSVRQILELTRLHLVFEIVSS